MTTNDLNVAESPKVQGTGDSIPYALTTTPWGSAPTSVSVSVLDLTNSGLDVTTTVMPSGSVTTVGDVITTKNLTALTAGHWYRIVFAFTVSGKAETAYLDVFATGVPAPTNGYITLLDFKVDKRIKSGDAVDDYSAVDIITDASRLIDRICKRTFYARAAETRYYDRPHDNVLWLDDDLLSVTTLTNGDGTTIASSYYLLQPYNGPAHYAIMLRPGQGGVWQMNTTYGDSLHAISVLGTWGFCDRAATDWESVERIRNSRAACLDIAVWEYGKRFGDNVNVVVKVTAAGVVVTPQGEIPSSAWQKIKGYVRSID